MKCLCMNEGRVADLIVGKCTNGCVVIQSLWGNDPMVVCGDPIIAVGK